MVFLKKDGDKHTARDPFIVTTTGPKVTVQKMRHTGPNSLVPPRITSDKLKIDPKFLYIPPHRRLGTPGSGQPPWRRSACPPPRPLIGAPSQDDWKPLRPTRVEDWDEDITIVTSVAETPNFGGQGDAMEEEEGEVGADDEEVRAEARGGEAEGGGGEGREAAPHPDVARVGRAIAPHPPRPAPAHGPRRRPPREQWVLQQDALVAQQPPQQAVDPAQSIRHNMEAGLCRVVHELDVASVD